LELGGGVGLIDDPEMQRKENLIKN